MTYIIPFKKRPVRIGQGFNGMSHRKWPEDKEDFSYSIDFLLPEGTKIIASRSGVVEALKINGKKNYSGRDLKKGEEAYKKWMNELIIKHSDGTYAAYSHLKYKGSFVKIGDKVKQGQVIALSGNTGWSSAPHLDFTVFKKNSGKYKIKSIKIKFKDYNGHLEDMEIKMKKIIFTDLDGTLLDSRYSYSDAKPALKLIEKKKIPLVICTSKTRAEIEYYRKKLKNRHPFISDNGGAVFIPKKYFDFKFKYDKTKGRYYVIELGTELKKLRDFVKKIKRMGFKIISFDGMTAKQVAKDTGLPLSLAKLAKKREYNLPVKIPETGKKNKNSIIKRLKAEAKKAGLSFIKGGRYSHITGKNDKGKAVKILLRLYRKKYKRRKGIKSIGIGDSENDFPMLDAVDMAFLVQRPDKSYSSEKKKYKRAKGISTKGWNNALMSELKEEND